MRQLLLISALLLAAASAYGEQLELATSSLASWNKLTFPFNARHSTYAVVVEDGKSAIHVESDNAASALVYGREFDTFKTPILRWSWKAVNVLTEGNAEAKSGDDYPVRIYVMFPFDVERFSVLDRIRYEAERDLLGYAPPADVLNYVWANRSHAHNPIPNAYSERGAMFFADTGIEHLGEWRTHSADIIEDFRLAFGREPPTHFTVAIMGDTDNTHGRTDAYIRGISVSSE